LAFWNEKPADLAACVKGAARIADRIVAVDGAYRRYPDATAKSSHWQVKAIEKAAAEAGIECVIHQPDELWAGQIAKRTFLLREASKDADWVVVVDADHIISTSRKLARAALARMPVRVRSVGVHFATPSNEKRDINESAASFWHKSQSGTVVKDFAQIFRAMPDYTVEKKHWVYVGTYDGARTEVKYGASADAPIGVPYTVRHMTLHRDEASILAGRAFLNDRQWVVAQTGQEDDMSSLPRPKWDYEALAFSPPEPPKPPAPRPPPPPPPGTEPPKPWSWVTPNPVLNLPEAARGLEKGYPVRVMAKGNSMRPLVRSGEWLVLDSKAEPKIGSVVLALAARKLHIAKVGTVTPDGRYQIADMRGRIKGYTRRIYGVAVDR
jgi:hypothetical protein